MHKHLFPFVGVALLTASLLPSAAHGESGVEKSSTINGYTLVAPAYHTTTYLIDMDGQVFHYWKCNCAPGMNAYLLENGNLLRTGTLEAPPQPKAVRGTPLGGGMFGFGGWMNGVADRGGGAGGRIQEIDWDGKVVWEFQFVTPDHLLHHDIKRMPNGNILCIAWERKTAQEVVNAGRDPRFQGNSVLHPDFIIEVKPDKVHNGGEVVWEWHAWDHLIQDFDKSKANYGDVAAHPELIDINFSGERVNTPAATQPAARGGGFGAPGGFGPFGGAPGGAGMPGLSGAGGTVPPDWMHTNAIAYNAQLDQVMISSYGFSEIWIIDHSTATQEAKGHTGGKYGRGGDLLYRWGNPRAYRAGTKKDEKFFNQHNADWIADGLPGAGHIMVFNNGPFRPDGDYSSIDEIVPPVDADGKYPSEKDKAYGPREVVWSYSASHKTDFFSMHISGAQRLPNGNTLICSGAYGVLLEISPEKKVIWRCAYTGAGGPNGPDVQSPFGGPAAFPGAPNRGGGFGGFGPPGMGGLPGFPANGNPRGGPTASLPRFVVSREDPEVSGLKGMPSGLPRWGGGPGFGNLESQVFRVYRYAADYPGLKAKTLKTSDEKK